MSEPPDPVAAHREVERYLALADRARARDDVKGAMAAYRQAADAERRTFDALPAAVVARRQNTRGVVAVSVYWCLFRGGRQEEALAWARERSTDGSLVAWARREMASLVAEAEAGDQDDDEPSW